MCAEHCVHHVAGQPEEDGVQPAGGQGQSGHHPHGQSHCRHERRLCSPHRGHQEKRGDEEGWCYSRQAGDFRPLSEIRLFFCVQKQAKSYIYNVSRGLLRVWDFRLLFHAIIISCLAGQILHYIRSSLGDGWGQRRRGPPTVTQSTSDEWM